MQLFQANILKLLKIRGYDQECHHTHSQVHLYWDKTKVTSRGYSIRGMVMQNRLGDCSIGQATMDTLVPHSTGTVMASLPHTS
ncbi:unnamed protein product [Callosobruchus maculatus]|uniref:Uncharacterized protein n=1 Tax=Callosobruchus maculatus TaxID=64391 RepID=A0A653CGL0_CALMS|nr:unnamed protein product [Callosobruchus maculatus]